MSGQELRRHHAHILKYAFTFALPGGFCAIGLCLEFGYHLLAILTGLQHINPPAGSTGVYSYFTRVIPYFWSHPVPWVSITALVFCCYGVIHSCSSAFKEIQHYTAYLATDTDAEARVSRYMFRRHWLFSTLTVAVYAHPIVAFFAVMSAIGSTKMKEKTKLFWASPFTLTGSGERLALIEDRSARELEKHRQRQAEQLQKTEQAESAGTTSGNTAGDKEPTVKRRW